ncbi:thioredoxin 1 [Nostocoides japonicum T1-X7]|uniref:Thioredoxin n=1 Tax=Nostocoides japonicum T1-X7 TaxID=1194083 RepID=A0A077M7X9_9MICO|nr:thioredoxin [Tetrasphaera japonica]CCH80169.1 thioredoxin 1 [Tetrasphaera japonica T1-X7]
MAETTATIATTDATFEDDVLTSDKPVLVDFWAVWCGPCRAVAPVVEEIATQYADRLKVVKLNTDENPGVSARYGITSIPSLYVFQNGEVVKTIIGAKPKPVLVRELSDFIS